MNEYPTPGSIWAHDTDRPRRVREVDQQGARVRWDRKGKPPRWVQLDTWRKWSEHASEVQDWPVRAAALVPEPPTEANTELVLVDLGDYRPELRGVLGPAQGTPLAKAPELYIEVVAECLARGCEGSDLASVFGMSLPTVYKIIKGLRKRYASVTPGMLALRRERTYQQSLRVYRTTMHMVEGLASDTDEDGRMLVDPKGVAALLGRANEAIKSMRAIVGADMGVESAGEGSSTTVNVINPVAHIGSQLGIDSTALERIGALAAQAISNTAREKEGLPVQAIEGEP